MRGNRVVWLPGLLIFATTMLGAAHAGGEISLLATSVSGDYDTGIDSDTQGLTLRYVTGRRMQFQADLPWVHADGSASGATYTGLGSMSGGRYGSGSMAGAGNPPGSVTVEPASTTGLGDVRLALAGPVMGGGVKLYRVDASAEVKIPTADEDNGFGTGEWDYRVGLAAEYRFWSASVFGGVGWNALGDSASLELDNVVDAYVGLDSDPFAGDRWIATGWLEGWQSAVDSVDDRAAVGFGVRTTGKLRWRVQARVGLTDGSEDLAVIVGVSYGIAPRGPGARGHQR